MEKFDKVTPEMFGIVLTMANINLEERTIEKIIDIIWLLDEKGEDVTLKDMLRLKKIWKEIQEVVASRV